MEGTIGRGRRYLARREAGYRLLAVAVMLALGAIGVWSAWDFARDASEREAEIRFEFEASRIRDAIRGRMVDYEQVLRGGVGLFAASESVERNEWRAYVQHLRIEEIYPGIQALGFAPRVAAERKDQHERSMAAAGYSQYAIRPEGSRAEYVPFAYIEPFSGRNLRVVGFDAYSEAMRREALDRARDSGEPSISGRVTLMQETDQDVQAGFLMFVPVYRSALDVVSPAQRRAALAGYIYGSFRADDLMRGILGRLPDVRLRIFDGDRGEGLLYDSAPAAAPHAPLYEAVAKLPMRGRTWTLHASSLPAFEQSVDRRTPRIVAAATAAIGALLLAIIWSLATLRARAERLASDMTYELRASRERLALAIEGSGQALFDWDVATGKVVLSEQWSLILGGAPRGTTTTIADLQALVHPDDMPEVRRQTTDLVRGRLEFYRVEHRVRTADGDWRWVASRAKVVERDAAGRTVRVAGTNADITERKEIERLKAEFVATVSHELRTPLTAILGALGLLGRQAGDSLPADAAMFLRMAQQNGERLAALVNNILDSEKIESGHMDFRLETLAVGPLLERAVALNAPYAEKFSVRYDLARPLPEVAVAGDADRLIQVITNLMSNAAKFSPAGAVVTVSAQVRDSKARVSVSDRGPGIPEAFRDRIFGKFAQADASDTRQKGGTGLGLAISKAIVEQMGGAMGFDSTPGEGATFWFELPLAQP